MSRGNQRDRDRERAQARAGGKPKNPKTDGLTPEQRRERDARALQEKLAKKAGKDSLGAIKRHQNQEIDVQVLCVKGGAYIVN